MVGVGLRIAWQGSWQRRGLLRDVGVQVAILRF